jgi:hypothetical protein
MAPRAADLNRNFDGEKSRKKCRTKRNLEKAKKIKSLVKPRVQQKQSFKEDENNGYLTLIKS